MRKKGRKRGSVIENRERMTESRGYRERERERERKNREEERRKGLV